MSEPRAPRVARLRETGMITLRLDPAEAGLAEAAAGALDLAPPALRRAETAGGRRLLWMSPDEWLLMAPRPEIAGALEALAPALEGRRALAVDVSDARAAFSLEGEGAREALAKGAPADLSPQAFGVGDVRRTRLGQVAAAFLLTADAPPRFELICFRSVAAHVEAWLETAVAPGTIPRLY